MAAGGQVGSQKQQQQQTQQNSGTYTGTTGGTTAGSSTYTPSPTSGWQGANANAAGALGGGGTTGDQQSAIDFMKYQMQNQPINWALDDNNKNITSILGTAIPGVETSNVDAPSAYSQMTPYRGAYASDVLDPSLAAFDRGASINDNAVRASRGAGSAFGDRAAVADNERAAATDTARGALAGNITGQGLQWAGGMGAGDAAGKLSASGQNAGNRLAATGQTAANALTGRNQALQGQGMIANNLQSIENNGLASAAALYGMSGGGIDQILKYMGSQTPAFGSGTDTSGATTGTASGSSASQGSGTGSGSGSSKGGGVSVPIF